MESKKPAPATQQPQQQQHLLAHHVHPAPNLHLHNHNHVPVTNRLNSPQPYQIQPNGIVHQLLMQNPTAYQTNLHTNSNPDARSPLLENQQELYGTRQTLDHQRHYGANDNYPYTPKQDTRTDTHQPNHNINQDIMHAIPKGYNAEVYHDYMKRNPPKDTNQIYQNHQSTYQSNVSQYTNKPYLPYTNRIQPPTESNTELLRRQYNEIQQMKLRQQMRYQSEAQMQQQQTFAERQLLLQQMHGVQPPPNLQQNIYSDSHYKDLDRYMASQQGEREDRFQPQSPSTTYQTSMQAKQPVAPMSPMKSSGESSSPSVKSPVSSESRRSSGGTQALRSPIAQRPASAPVTMSGMLYKQGSDGLKVWRKRWFVLAEYCLFYYKSQEEEKLLGSVLLPSYQVSACTSEDKVLRKYAFKLQHANMRTYVLAAPDHDAMIKWVKALTMAALMQDYKKAEEKRKQIEINQIEVKEEEGDENAGPTYVNAPPKPRRTNDGYSSPTPDIYDPNYDLLQKPASHYSQGNQNRYSENQNRHPETNQNRYPDQKRYSETNQNRYPETSLNRHQETNQARYQDQRPTTNDNFDLTPQSPQYDHYGTKRSYDNQNLSLPLTNTSSDRLEHQHSALPYRTDSQPSHYDNRARSYQQQQRQEQKANEDRLNEQIYGRNQTQSLLYTKEKSQNERQMDLQNRNYKESGNETGHPGRIDPKKCDSDANPNVYNRDNYGDKPKQGIKAPPSERLPIERRTPDAYGRSVVLPSYGRGKTSDYEDIYPAYSGDNEYGSSYTKPTGPPVVAEKKNAPNQSYQPDYSTNYTPTATNQNQGFSGPSVLRRKKMQSSNPIPNVQRPHSADFLEYESKNEINKTMPDRTVCEPAKQPQRPKSSLDINSYYDPSSDRYYSEESYAEKMRQSAQYLQQRPMSSKDFQVPLAKYSSGLAQKQLDSAYGHNLNNNYETTYDTQTPKDNVSYNSKYSDLEVLNSNWTLKEKSALEKDYLNRTGSAMSDGSNISGYLEAVAQREHLPDNFLRSASARLPSTATEGKDGERKVKQREESMKRLLEWKQRMLQSPLTRKSTPASISLARSLNQSRQTSHRASDQYKPKSSAYTNASYNSYSSDDEDQASDIEPHVTRKTQAGRSQTDSPLCPRVSQIEHPPTNPGYAKETAAAPQIHTHGPARDAVDCTYENIACTSPITHTRVESNTSNNTMRASDSTYDKSIKTEYTENVTEVDLETDDSEAESEKQMEYTDDDLDEVLYQSDTEFHKNQPEPSESGEQKDEEEPPSTPIAVSHPEDHYLPMSPRKTSTNVEPPHQNIIKHLSVFDGSRPLGFEDNPYVEMSLGNETDEAQTYEIVCVNNGKVEPVYMELNNISCDVNDITTSPTTTVFSDIVTNFADTKDLTLKRPGKDEKGSKDKQKKLELLKGFGHKNQRSDCSDADDEASKDISLSAPFNRFSISDTFRPASYYLSGSRNVLDLQDSSDSELVSPPPIPSSTPPLDDVGDNLSKYVLDKLEKSNLSADNSILKLLQSEENNKLNTVKRKTTSLMIYGSRPSIHDTLFRGEKVRHSRASLSNDKSKDTDMKNTSFLSSSYHQHYNSNRSIETDSLTSYNADRGSSRLSVDSDVSSKFDRTPSNMSSERTSLNESEAVEFRNSNMSQQEMENIMKRRPLSDDSFFDIDSLDSVPMNEAASNVDLDQYLDNLQNKPPRPMSDVNLNYTKSKGIPSISIVDRGQMEKTPPASHTRSSSTPVGLSLVSGQPGMAPNKSSLYKGFSGSQSRCNIGFQSSTSSVEATSTPISYYKKNFDEESTLNKNLNRAISADKIKEFEGDKIVLKSNNDSAAGSSASTIFHSRESSTEQSAPYYYSDLSSQEHINVLPTSHYLKNTNVNRKLNNQRRRGPLNKKNEISHIHNPIHNSQQSHFIADRPFELAAAARCVSVEFLSAADKNPEIDMKNIYESTTLKIPKIRDSMSSLHSSHSSKNTSLLASEQNEVCSPQSGRVSANNSRSPNATNSSLRGEVTKDLSRIDNSRTVLETSEGIDSDTYDTLVCEGDMLWDEDALWRDNLRRASHRHARSMDDLDVLPVDSHRPGRSSVDLNSMKNSQTFKKDGKTKRITRNVTYVNTDIQNQVFGSLKRNKVDFLGGGQVDTITKIDENDVYVSLACENVLQEHSDEGVYEKLAIESSSDPSGQNSLNSQDTTEKPKKKFEIDRENLRQWDFLSSGLMKKGTIVGAGGGCAGAGEPSGGTDSGADSATNEASVSMSGASLGQNVAPNQQSLVKKSFVGSNTSIGRSTRDNNIPVRAVSPRVRWVEDKSQTDTYGTSRHMSTSQQNLTTSSLAEDSWATARSPSRMSQQPIRAVSPRVRRHTDNDDLREAAGEVSLARNRSLLTASSVEQLLSDKLTAGELLGRTHEELVLLLIQLRRRHAATYQAVQQCTVHINTIKDCLGSLTALERQESLQRLEQLKLQLMDLEHQYEKSKPLVHLVDNMVKLGSLYNRPTVTASNTIDRLERNQRLRQKVLAEQAEEQRRWVEGEVGDPEAARARVEELWALERELATEAATLRGLKADKDVIESLLTGYLPAGVRSKFSSLHLSEAATADRSRGTQEALEADLARVHAMLAHNSKKLEATVADNARLERELLALRRALHAHRHTPAPTTTTTATTALLEDEVARVQQLVSALQRQRQELSRAVRHLTHQSRALQTNTQPAPAPAPALYPPGTVKRRMQTLWLETDLDSGECVEHGIDDIEYDTCTITSAHYDSDNLQPLYVDTHGQHQDVTSPITSDDGMHSGLGNLSNVEKQEIKTVRIVKRESERRQRDRDRSIQPNEWSTPSITANLDHLLEEELAPNHYTGRSTSLPRTQPQYSRPEDYYKAQSRNQPPNYLRLSNVNVPNELTSSMELSPKYPSSPSLTNYDYSRDMSTLSSSYNRSYDYSGQGTLSLSTQFLNSPTDSNRTLTNDPLSKTSSIGSLTRNAELSPIFKSEAAKQIITEMAGDGQPKNTSSLHRRQVPKEKRRHYTAPHHLSAKTLSEMPSEYFNQEKLGRSLDDADMERALRAPPDVVRSAMPPQRYAESTIDQLLLAPRKILIPERYIPEKPPELSPEEQKKRLEKVESIKKMLSGTASADPSKSPDGENKRQREHLLQMNQILAKQVMEMSKIVAEKALEDMPQEETYDSDDRSPEVELPIYQQRDNFFT